MFRSSPHILLLIQRLHFFVQKLASRRRFDLLSAIAASTACLIVLPLFVYVWVQHTKLVDDVTVPFEESRHPPVSTNTAQIRPLLLPAFSTGDLPAQLQAAAKTSGLPVDAVSYQLDSKSERDYLRYTARVSTTASYAQFRRFILVIQDQASHIALDDMQCEREDIADVELACELAVSAFYRVTGRV